MFWAHSQLNDKVVRTLSPTNAPTYFAAEFGDEKKTRFFDQFHLIQLNNGPTAISHSHTLPHNLSHHGKGKKSGNTKGGSIDVQLASCLTGLESAV
jgi:hypothetical protein